MTDNNGVARLLYAIGHSNRSLEFFAGLLLGYGIERLIDVRTIRRSRHNPQFNGDTLRFDLPHLGIAYTPLPLLGGRRHAKRDSINTAWTNNAFRGYADYMQTPEFERGLERLIGYSKKQVVAFMCAEAVPWRCHRSLIADALTARGYKVRQIMSRVSAPTHRLTPWARIRRGRVFYPGAA